MKRRLFFLMMVIVSCCVSATAQDGRVTVKGTVIDSHTGGPVAFANLGLLGTVAGTASDIDGIFELTVPDKYSTHVIRVTAVGYANMEFKVYEGAGKPDLKIRLKPVTYGMGEVDVYGQLLVYKKMLRNVVSSISKNYISKPYNYQGYFKYTTQRGDEEKVKEAIVTVYDAEGYHRDNVAAAFKALHYNFSEVRRSQEPASVWDGLTYFDDVLTADIVRNTRNVLDIVNARDYKLKSKGKLLYEGDSVQVIGYEGLKPSISTAGDPSVQSYHGEIYINLKDMAVLKNVAYLTSRDFNALGRNLVTVEEQPKKDVKMTITTTYKKLNSVYFLSGVNIEYAYEEAGIPVKGEAQFITTRLNVNTPTPIEGRTYYEDRKTNEDFCKNYSVSIQE